MGNAMMSVPKNLLADNDSALHRWSCSLRVLLLVLIIFAPFRAAAANFLYIIDTSKSMQSHRKTVAEAVKKDILRALQGQWYAAGDRIRVWAFTSDVFELVKVDYKPGVERELGDKLDSNLKNLKIGILTNIAQPLIKALEEFRAAEMGDLSIFLYTDGQDSVSNADATKVLRHYNNDFKPGGRLRRMVLVQFGKSELPASTRELIASIGGTTVIDGRTPELATAPKAEKVMPSTNQTTVTVLPAKIQFSAGVASEIMQPAVLEFMVSPARSGLLVSLALETPQLPVGMSLGTLTDRLAAEGRQSIVFTIKNAPAGRYSGKLKLSAPVRVEPGEIPVEIEIVPSKPGQIGLQFFPERQSLLEFPAQSQWQNIPNAGLSLFYPDALSQTLIRVDGDVPAGVEIQILPGGDPGKPIGTGRAVKLAELGHTASFQIRQLSEEVIGKNHSARLTVHVEAEKPVTILGTNTITIPFQFVSPVEVQVETPEIDLGSIASGTRIVKRNVAIRVKGSSEGKTVRFVKQGQGLTGLTIAPAEIALTPGLMSVDLEFSGFDGHPPGSFTGTLLLVQGVEGPSIKIPPAPVSVRGRIAEPARIIAEVENPMVAGQPMFVRARFDLGERGAISAVVHPPDGRKDHEIALVDTGSVEEGDSKANDGLYSGVYKQTETLGSYQITISARGTTNSVALSVPIYFKAPADPLVGSIAKRKQNEVLRFKSAIVSDFPESLAIHEEAVAVKNGLSTFLSNKEANRSLEPGKNSLDLSVALTPEIEAGEYKYHAYLVTDPIEGKRARIPLAIEIKVLSVFHYFARLLFIALGLAIVAFLAIAKPWKRLNSRRKNVRPAQPARSREKSLAE
jgi:hypothetical protein